MPKPTAAMSFRRRITLVSAAAVAIAVVLASALTYLLSARELYGQVDSQLRARAHPLVSRFEHGPTPFARRGAHHNAFPGIPPGPDQVRGYQQLIDSNGTILFASSPNVKLPIGAKTLSLAAHGGKSFFEDSSADGIHLRVLTEAMSHGYAAQLAQPLTDVDSALARLRLILVLLDIGGVALAALLGRLVAGAAVAPIKRLTQATEHVTRTQDLSNRIQPAGEDEIGRLAESFNAMLDALGELDERARRLRARPAPARRRRLARAAHTRHQPAHEHRNPEAGAEHAGAGTPAHARRRGRADRGADTADERPDRAWPRRAATQSAARTCAWI